MQVTYIHGSWQIPEMLQGFKDGEGHIIKGMTEVSAVDEYNNKILNTIPHAFIDLKEDIHKIMAVIEKYCKSFFKGKTDPYLETVYHYDLKIKDFREAIDMHIDNIFKMGESYRGSGLVVKSFGFTTNELARKCSCGDLPFLLMFPEACQVRSFYKVICIFIPVYIGHKGPYRSQGNRSEMARAKNAPESNHEKSITDKY